ncbi:MAG: DUF2239 family protein [Bacteroidota bacterium]|jgi:hypothetical protein|nr:DUF2239 family protein [Bacteroidota bacterium]
MYTQIAHEAIAFDGHRLVGKGDMREVARNVKLHVDRHADASVLVFDADTSAIVELDLRGTLDEVLARVETRLGAAETGMASPEGQHRGPGRPKLGVVGREVTLLPRHWEWLEQQPGGASVTLRKLVEEARKSNSARDRIRIAQESAYRFMNAMAGDLRGYEEALRALYAGDAARFAECISSWPVGIRTHTEQLAGVVFHRSMTE